MLYWLRAYPVALDTLNCCWYQALSPPWLLLLGILSVRTCTWLRRLPRTLCFVSDCCLPFSYTIFLRILYAHIPALLPCRWALWLRYSGNTWQHFASRSKYGGPWGWGVCSLAQHREGDQPGTFKIFCVLAFSHLVFHYLFWVSYMILTCLRLTWFTVNGNMYLCLISAPYITQCNI